MTRKDPWFGTFCVIFIIVAAVTRGCDSRPDLPADLTDNEICQGPSQVGNDC